MAKRPPLSQLGRTAITRAYFDLGEVNIVLDWGLPGCSRIIVQFSPFQQIPTFIAQTNNASIHAGLQTICTN